MWIGGLVSPAEGGDVEAGEVEDAIDDCCGELVNCGGEAVEGGGGGADDAAGEGYCFHVADVDEVVGSFAGDADELTAFFEDDVGGSCDEVG